MKFHAISAALLAAAMITTATGDAFAQRYRDYRNDGGGFDDAYNRSGRTRSGERLRNPAPYVGASDRYGYPVDPRNPNACIKLCVGDNNPCDPIQYKTADNRCGSRF